MSARKSVCLLMVMILLSSMFLYPSGSAQASAAAKNPSSSSLAQGDKSSDKQFDKKDIPRAVAYMKKNDKRALKPVTPVNKGRPSPENPYFVQPILFIASDLSETAENRVAINETFQMLKRWYSGALEYNNSGYAYRVIDTIVFHAPQPFSYYKCPNHEVSCDTYDGIWGNVQVELYNAGFPLWSDGTSYVVFVKGAGGWAGANNTSDNSYAPAPGPASKAGFGILGDWALDAISGTTNEECFAAMGTACYRDPQRGAVGHELGHTFALGHARDVYGSIMSSWWDFPFVSLISAPGNDEKGMLRNESLFFTPHACAPDSLVDEVMAPSGMLSGGQSMAAFTVTNYGFCHWAATSTVLQLVSKAVWGVKQQPLDADVYPAQPHTFTLTLTAPVLKANMDSVDYESYWQMRILKNNFGPVMGNTITITR